MRFLGVGLATHLLVVEGDERRTACGTITPRTTRDRREASCLRCLRWARRNARSIAASAAGMKISLETARALSLGHLTRSSNGFSFVLGEQLDRKAYEAVAKAIDALGGKWSRGLKAHVFAEDPTDAIDLAVCAGQVTTRREDGFFPTPGKLVSRLVDLARTRPGMRAIEPSAGVGAIALELRARGVEPLCFELDPKNVAALRRLELSVVQGDWLAQEPPVELFDRVVMNPPFGKSSDVKHVLHALRFLKPGGRLAAICSAGVAFRRGPLYEELRSILEARGEIERLPSGSFAESGTSCETVLLAIDA